MARADGMGTPRPSGLPTARAARKAAARRRRPAPAPPVADASDGGHESAEGDAGAPARGGPGEQCAFALREVARLAAYGLTQEEVVGQLHTGPPLSVRRMKAVEAAFRKGRASGIARIKQAQFEAAVEGKTTAQASLLARLGAAEEGETEADEVELRRVIIAGDEAHPRD